MTDIIKIVCKEFGFKKAKILGKLGGTAAAKFAVELDGIRYVLRQRQDEMAIESMIRFDHEMLIRLFESGLPVPVPQKTACDTTWFCAHGKIYEILSWVEGEPFCPGNRNAIENLGFFMAKFHSVSADNIPHGKDGVKREDHPDVLMPYVNSLEAICQTDEERRQIALIRGEVCTLKSSLEEGLYYRLPMAVIHGDVHPGNLAFKDSCVSAVYDFDYMSRQARVRDICDCLAFFCSIREDVFNVDDIYSLTQAFRFDPALVIIFLRAYNSLLKLETLEFESFPIILKALWLNMRLRGCRKVSNRGKLDFVLRDFWSMRDWIDKKYPKIIISLQAQL